MKVATSLSLYWIFCNWMQWFTFATECATSVSAVHNPSGLFHGLNYCSKSEAFLNSFVKFWTLVRRNRSLAKVSDGLRLKTTELNYRTTLPQSLSSKECKRWNKQKCKKINVMKYYINFNLLRTFVFVYWSFESYEMLVLVLDN